MATDYRRVVAEIYRSTPSVLAEVLERPCARCEAVPGASGKSLGIVGLSAAGSALLAEKAPDEVEPRFLLYAVCGPCRDALEADRRELARVHVKVLRRALRSNPTWSADDAEWRGSARARGGGGWLGASL